MQNIATYFASHGAEYTQMVGEHLGISALSLLVAAIIAVPLGIACSRWNALEKMGQSFFLCDSSAADPAA